MIGSRTCQWPRTMTGHNLNRRDHDVIPFKLRLSEFRPPGPYQAVQQTCVSESTRSHRVGSVEGDVPVCASVAQLRLQLRYDGFHNVIVGLDRGTVPFHVRAQSPPAGGALPVGGYCPVRVPEKLRFL
eukprot:3933814-Rhodomonas_salina.1